MIPHLQKKRFKRVFRFLISLLPIKCILEEVLYNIFSMKKILIPMLILGVTTSAIVPAFARSSEHRDQYGCETWEGEKWDAKLGRCMDADDYYDDDIRYAHPTPSVNNPTPVNTSSDSDVAVYEWAKSQGLTTAANFRAFRDEARITRDEVAVIVHRAVKGSLFPALTASGNKTIAQFQDGNRIGKEFVTAIEAVQNAGIMRGNGRGYFLPKNFLTEYEALVIAARSVKKEVHNATEAQAFARSIGESVDMDDMNDTISRGDFFEMIKKAAGR